MVIYGVAFLGGLAGSLHCVGMCGGFPLALARHAGARNRSRQFLYQLGRVNALVFLGAVAGLAGATLVAAGPLHVAERILAIAAGVIMVLVGGEMLGFPTRISAVAAQIAQATVGRAMPTVAASTSPAAPLALGVLNAFLPCHLIYAFAARAAATGSALDGMATMLAFALGTVPAMLTLGLTSVLLRPAVRAPLSRAAAILVVASGVVTIARGVAPALGGGHVH